MSKSGFRRRHTAVFKAKVAPGNDCAPRLRENGDKAGLEWDHEAPGVLRFSRFGDPRR